MEIQFKPGDRFRIIRSGCNNLAIPESSYDRCLDKGDTIYTAVRVETEGRYRGSGEGYYTLITEFGHPIWADHCELVKEEVINNYSIF